VSEYFYRLKYTTVLIDGYGTVGGLCLGLESGLKNKNECDDGHAIDEEMNPLGGIFHDGVILKVRESR
jgi:hypothetical protein